ncbi:DUF3179 domain-containing protein [Halobacteria archaeon AArc-curdl1]|uniref:DUF3179 domain-containing protein n=1 Tax=Natronosalvus hydrolyticus TaxID=2979988 RepID=A0AAP3E5I4_9EURY|nr:DUF3179 domain-containing protein [Halobacteria archaeon AArc-curdl1]
MSRPSRRHILALAGGTVLGGLAGCFGDSDDGLYDSDETAGDTDTEGDGASATRETTADGPDESALEETDIPIADEQLPLEYPPETLREETISGGVPKDGIPSIDDPTFEGVDDVGNRLDDGDPVFGLVIDGDVRAYPQSVLVYHEIVNDNVGTESVAVTYCPLTGTAMGFARNGVEFGVSGTLVNSNLVMYDREGDSRWPQMLATAIDGPLEGASLEEVPVHWSTWGQWKSTHPETQVLTTDTGYARDYNSDPYGAYNPAGGYYREDSPTMFTPLSTDERLLNKRMVLGARPADGALAFDLERLADEGVLSSASVTDREETYLAVYDDRIGAGHLYRSDSDTYEYDGDTGTVVTADATAYEPDELPLESVYAFDAMWFAWAGFYPSTALID